MSSVRRFPPQTQVKKTAEEIAEVTDGVALGQWQRIDLLLRLPLSTSEKLVLIAIARFQSRRAGFCYASHSSIAANCSLGPRQARRLIQRLCDADFLRMTVSPGHTNLLEIKWEHVEQIVNPQSVPWTPMSRVTPDTHVQGGESVTPTPDISDIDPGHLRHQPWTFETPTLDTHVHQGLLEGLQEGLEERACAVAHSLSPAFSDSEENQPQPLNPPVKENPKPSRHGFREITDEELRERRLVAEEARAVLPEWMKKAAGQ